MKLIKETQHRPYPLPSKRWIMKQVWNDVTFLHWPVPIEALRPYIPAPLQIDTFDGEAWIGVIAFKINGIYFRGLSAVSVVPSFTEINVRTYVSFNGKSGVFFMSLDVSDWASLNIAKRWYCLPYHEAKLSFESSGQAIHYKSARLKESVAFAGTCKPLSDVYFPKAGTLDHWLTERYSFYTANHKKMIFHGDIHHQPWPLQPAHIHLEENTLFSPFDLSLSTTHPIVHFSKGVESLMWNCKKMNVL